MTAEALYQLGPIAHVRTLREYSLVLKSLEISHDFHASAEGYYISIASIDQERALEALRSYEIENQHWPPRSKREKLPYASTQSGIWLALILALFFLITGPVSSRSVWFEHGTAVSKQITHGAIWQAATALTLHADTAHILGNAVAGGVFFSSVHKRLGTGRGLFFTLAAGIAGNVANAFFQEPTHRSIGASTAVFAAIGILVGTQFLTNERNGSHRWVERAKPWVGGFVLLGLLGASPQSDIWAHFWGLACGIPMGLLAMWAMHRSKQIVVEGKAQWIYMCLSMLILVGSWYAAFRFSI